MLKLPPQSDLGAKSVHHDCLLLCVQGCTIGAGSVVTKVPSPKACVLCTGALSRTLSARLRGILHVWLQDVEPYTVVAGNPARVIKRLAQQDQEDQSS